jgi:hypothetical protein
MCILRGLRSFVELEKLFAASRVSLAGFQATLIGRSCQLVGSGIGFRSSHVSHFPSCFSSIEPAFATGGHASSTQTTGQRMVAAFRVADLSLWTEG